MIPSKLRLSGFLSYLDPVELSFADFDLACISGSNGAGKSSIFDAITWALFGQARRRDDALINSQADSAEVIFDFSYENSLYRVQRVKPRDKTTLLEFFIQAEDGRWRPLTQHSVRETELLIQQTLRLDYETFTNASFFLQGKADQFAQQRSGDRKRILSSILGLEVWETYRETAAEKRRQVDNETAALDSLLVEIDGELREEPERRARLKDLEERMGQANALRRSQESLVENLRRLSAAVDEQRRLVELLNTQWLAARQRTVQRSDQLAARQAEKQEIELRLGEAAQIQAKYQQWQDSRKELERWEAIAANFRQNESQRSAPLVAIEGERARLEEERRSLENTAQQVSTLVSTIPALENQLKISQAEIDGLLEQAASRVQIEAQLRQLEAGFGEAQAENRRLKEEMDELKPRIDRLKSASGAECPLCGQPLEPDERLLLIATLETQGKEKGDRHRANQVTIREFEQRRSQLETNLASLSQVDEILRARQRQADQIENQIAQAHQVEENWKSVGALRLQEIQQTLTAANYSLPAREELARIDAALKELGYDASTHDAVRQAELNGRASEEALRQLESDRAALSPLEREIATLEKHFAEDEAEAARQQKACQEAQEKLQVDSQNLPSLREAENDLMAVQEQENHLRMQVGGARQAVDVLTSLTARRLDLAAQRGEHSLLSSRLKTLERAFSKDGVPALLIEQALPEIETQANEIIDRLSAGNMSVSFETQREYADKKRDDRKETLDIIIRDANGQREYEMFSGGEAFRINFAIRLALSRVLANRAGARLQTLVIDEGFGSQDADGRQRLIEAINMVRPDFAKILVITHLEELKDAFPARIEVEKTPRGSQLKVIV